MVYLVELSEDGGATWRVVQHVGIYVSAQHSAERARKLQERHAQLPPSNIFHGRLFRSREYVRNEAA